MKSRSVLPLRTGQRIFSLCVVGLLAGPSGAQNAGTSSAPKIPTEAQCEQGFGRVQTDCGCFVAKAREMSAKSPGTDAPLITMYAASACPSRTKIRNYTLSYCVDQHKLYVPAGIDDAQYCACFADEVANEHMAFSPKVHTGDTAGSFENRARAKCKQAVSAQAVQPEGADLSGKWFLNFRDVDFTLEFPAGKWDELDLPDGRRVKHFSGAVVLATGRFYGQTSMWIDPMKSSLTLQIPGYGCTADASPVEAFSGKCYQSNLAGLPFTMRRKK